MSGFVVIGGQLKFFFFSQNDKTNKQTSEQKKSQGEGGEDSFLSFYLFLSFCK
jgi:hypothetical protein